MNDAQRAVKSLGEVIGVAADWHRDVEAEVDDMVGEIDALNELLQRALDAGEQLDSGHRNDDEDEIKNALAEFRRIRQEIPA